MKPTSVLLLLVCLGTNAIAQTPKEKFILYSLQIDRAKTAAAHGERPAALAIYDSAFKLVPFMAEDHFDAVVNALAAGNDGRANDLLIQGTENGLVLEGLYDPFLQNFLHSDRCMPYLNMRDYMKARWLEHADTAMIQKVKNIGSWEAMVIDQNGSATPFADSTSYYRLQAFVKENGWPTPLTVGGVFRQAFNALPQPVADLQQDPMWQQVLPYIHAAMARGALPPDCLAPYQDMADVAQGKPMTYGTMLAFYADDSTKWPVVDRLTLERNRRSVGLGPFDDFLLQIGLDPQLVRYAEP